MVRLACSWRLHAGQDAVIAAELYGEHGGLDGEHAGRHVIQLNGPAVAAHARFPAPTVGVCHSCLATGGER